MSFVSDNRAGAAPEVMAALMKANDGYAPSYGSDPITDRVRDRIRMVFEAPKAEVHLVATGTAANALSAAIACPPWGAIFCHRQAHLHIDECGAPEFYTGGAKLVLVDGDHGKMTPATLTAAMGLVVQDDVHSVQRGMISLTNVTEAGTIYTPVEVAALTALARERGLPSHMDGARFANALVASGATPAEMTWKAGIDILSFGGTKNGLMGAEAVILFDPAKAWEFELRRKRAGHLFSKHRYLSAQMEAYLDGGLWLRLATHANHMAERLAMGIMSVPGAGIVRPVDANMLYAWFPTAAHGRFQKAGLDDFGLATSPERPARLVTSWATTGAEVDAFIGLVRG
jgi:threonine aldolase